jgi:hypothetical protein
VATSTNTPESSPEATSTPGGNCFQVVTCCNGTLHTNTCCNSPMPPPNAC